jgi:ElaA protein
VLPALRGQGLGAALIRAAVAEFRAMPGIEVVKLGAQTHALGFYERLGFVATGPVYQDAGIAHRDMVLTLRPAASGASSP